MSEATFWNHRHESYSLISVGRIIWKVQVSMILIHITENSTILLPEMSIEEHCLNEIFFIPNYFTTLLPFL